eukprot:jgi/Botrbrau1/9919/Bobra.0012s0019.2
MMGSVHESAMMVRTPPNLREGDESNEFYPLRGYDIPDLNRMLVLQLLDSEFRLSSNALADMNSSDVRLILQGYIKKFEVCMKLAERATGSIEPVMVQLTGLVNEAVAFGVLAGIASSTATMLWRLVPNTVDQEPAWVSLIGALHLSDEQERLLLAMRCTFLWSTHQQMEGTSATQLEGSGSSAEGSAEKQAQFLLNRQRCLFTDRALRQVLNPMQAAIAFTLASPDFPDMLPVANRIARVRDSGKKPLVVRAHSPIPARSLSPGPSPTAGQRRSLDLCPRTSQEESGSVATPKTDLLQEAFNRILKLDVSSPTAAIARTASSDGPTDPWQGLTLSSWIGSAHASCSPPVGSIGTDATRQPQGRGLAPVAAVTASVSSCKNLEAAVSGVNPGEVGNGSLGSIINSAGPMCGELPQWPARGRCTSMDSSHGWGGRQQSVVSAQVAAAAEGLLGRKYMDSWARNTGTPPERGMPATQCNSRTAPPSPDLISSTACAAISSFSVGASAGGRPPCGDLSGPGGLDIPLSPFSFSPPSAIPTCDGTGQWPSASAQVGVRSRTEAMAKGSGIEGIRSVSLNNWLNPSLSGAQPIGVTEKSLSRSASSLRPIGCITQLEGPNLRTFLSNPTDAQLAQGRPETSSFRQNLLGGWHPSTGSVGSPGHPAGPRVARADTLNSPHSLQGPGIRHADSDQPSVLAVGQVPVKKQWSFDNVRLT